MKNILKITTLVGILALTTFGATSLPAEAHDGWRHEARVERHFERGFVRPACYGPSFPVYRAGYAPVVYESHPIVTGILNAIGI